MYFDGSVANLKIRGEQKQTRTVDYCLSVIVHAAQLTVYLPVDYRLYSLISV
jgi:hypothetical protein